MSGGRARVSCVLGVAIAAAFAACGGSTSPLVPGHLVSDHGPSIDDGSMEPDAPFEAGSDDADDGSPGDDGFTGGDGFSVDVVPPPQDAGTCPPGDTLCITPNDGLLCTNTSFDDFNCGTCGDVCMGGAACELGVCSCPPGEMACSNGCVDITSDPTNCGGCNIPCATSCVGGVCASSPVGEADFTFPGTFEFTVPPGVKSVSAVVVGGGGGGSSASSPSAGGGGGGALCYANGFAVTPGNVVDVVVGAAGAADTAGGSSRFALSVIAGGGRGGSGTVGGPGGFGAGFVGTCFSGGAGGSFVGGPGEYMFGSGGGGAGGYLGPGGNGGEASGDSCGIPATDGAGGGGGGGGAASDPTNCGGSAGGGGGGVGLFGLGANGTAGQSSCAPAGCGVVSVGGGAGGSGGARGGGGSGTEMTTASAGSGGTYGGGGGGGSVGGLNGYNYLPGAGASGAVRIIWGPGRSFPNNAM